MLYVGSGSLVVKSSETSRWACMAADGRSRDRRGWKKVKRAWRERSGRGRGDSMVAETERDRQT